MDYQKNGLFLAVPVPDIFWSTSDAFWSTLKLKRTEEVPSFSIVFNPLEYIKKKIWEHINLFWKVFGIIFHYKNNLYKGAKAKKYSCTIMYMIGA